MGIFDTPVKFPDVESSCGPEPSLREILAHYYRQAFTADEAAALVNKYIDLLGVEAEVARLRAEVEDCRKDAERYRWLRAGSGTTWDQPWVAVGHCEIEWVNQPNEIEGKQLDDAIDAAMGASA